MVDLGFFNKDGKFSSTIILDPSGTTLTDRLNSKVSYSWNSGLNLNELNVMF